MSTPTRRAPRPVQRLARGLHDTVVRIRNLGVRAVSGDKPLAVGFLVAFVAAVVLLSGPMQSWMASNERVELREAQAAALEEANAELEQQKADLNDPAQLELRAREDGFVRPGEVPYVVVPPADDQPRIVDPLPEGAESTDDDPWFVRFWNGLTSIFGE